MYGVFPTVPLVLVYSSPEPALNIWFCLTFLWAASRPGLTGLLMRIKSGTFQGWADLFSPSTMKVFATFLLFLTCWTGQLMARKTCQVWVFEWMQMKIHLEEFLTNIATFFSAVWRATNQSLIPLLAPGLLLGAMRIRSMSTLGRLKVIKTLKSMMKTVDGWG